MVGLPGPRMRIRLLRSTFTTIRPAAPGRTSALSSIVLRYRRVWSRMVELVPIAFDTLMDEGLKTVQMFRLQNDIL
jgi:hypothetical protein